MFIPHYLFSGAKTLVCGRVVGHVTEFWSFNGRQLEQRSLTSLTPKLLLLGCQLMSQAPLRLSALPCRVTVETESN